MTTGNSRVRRLFLPFLCVLLWALCIENGATATAAPRFAAPGAQGAAASTCPRTAPCSVFAAAAQTPDSALRPGDEVIMEFGRYTAADFNRRNLQLAPDIQIRGEEGARRPLIVASSLQIEATAGDVVSNLELISEANVGLLINGATVEGVVTRDVASNSIACIALAARLVNSACIDSGASSAAIQATARNGLQASSMLRNVTAIATGTPSAGLEAQTTIFAGEASVDGKAVIAEGQGPDVLATAEMASAAHVTLDYSDFDTSAAPTAGATVTGPGTGHNITANPLLADDDIHELAGSPTIGTGLVDALSGPADIDGEARVQGASADVGADEFRPLPTSATVSCTPDRLLLGGPGSQCMVDVANEDGGTLGGDVTFTRDGSQLVGRCTLGARQATTATCTGNLSPKDLGVGVHSIAVQYLGDATHAPSVAAATIQVDRGTPRGSAPNTVLKKHPKAKTTRHRAVFSFVSNAPGSTFECRIDKARFKSCRSPLKRKVKRGRHTLSVRARNRAGVADPTPAVFRWRVL
jgi:Bacterial Ig-like domain (group 3)